MVQLTASSNDWAETLVHVSYSQKEAVRFELSMPGGVEATTAAREAASHLPKSWYFCPSIA